MSNYFTQRIVFYCLLELEEALKLKFISLNLSASEGIPFITFLTKQSVCLNSDLSSQLVLTCLRVNGYNWLRVFPHVNLGNKKSFLSFSYLFRAK